MSKLLYTLLGLILFAALSYAGLYYLAPASLVEAGIKYERDQAGLRSAIIKVDDHDIHYLIGGPDNAPVILMVHGYAANKDNWTRFAHQFVDRYKVIAVDLPGFGDSSKIANASYDIPSQQQRLAAFTEALELPKFHIVGNSMGGLVSAAMAIMAPEKVLSLGLFDSAGVQEPVLSPMTKAWAEGKNILLVNGPDDMDRVLKLAFNHPPKMPKIALDYLAKKSLEDKEFNIKIAEDLVSKAYMLEDKLAKITAPTLVLWGDSDRIIDVSAAEVFHAGLKQSSLVIMEDTGHLPMLEKPKQTAKHYQQFLKEISGK